MKTPGTVLLSQGNITVEGLKLTLESSVVVLLKVEIIRSKENQTQHLSSPMELTGGSA